jgi:hypothetical protein
MKAKLLGIILFSPLLLVGTEGQAHHSVPVNYEMGTDMEVQGIIQKINFRNPHSSIDLEVKTETGETEEWLVEMNAKNTMIRRGFDIERFTVGSELKVLGWKGKRPRTIYFQKGTLVDGTEIIWETTRGTHD